MTYTTSTRRPLRAQLLASAGIALVALLGTAAAAQTTQDARVDATRSLLNRQTGIAATAADADRTAHTLVVQSAAHSSSATVADTLTSATARANRSKQSLTLVSPDLALADSSTNLVTGKDRLVASAGAAVIDAQSLWHAPVTATVADDHTGIDTAAVRDVSLAVRRNLQEAIALGNDGDNEIALGGVSLATGAGIVSAQTIDAASPISASSGGRQALSTGQAYGSALDLDSNTTRATGYGNVINNALTANLAGISVPGGERITSIVPAIDNGAAAANAAFGVLSSQSLGGDVTARVGDAAAALQTVSSDTLDRSTMRTTNNDLQAAAVGNQSGNRVLLEGGTVASRGGGASNPIANVTNIQRIGPAAIRTIARGGTDVAVEGEAADAELANIGNAIHTTATGNLALGNVLGVRARVMSSRGPEGEGVGGKVVPDLPPVGSALVDADGRVTTSAALSVQNVQDYGAGGVFAGQLHPFFTASMGGPVHGSTVSVSDNTAISAATGNDARSALTIDANRLRTSADVNNVQSGAGDVISAMPGAPTGSGTIVTLAGPVSDSAVLIERNSSTGTSIGNVATSDLTVSATALDEGSGHIDAVAGPIGSGYGAAATFAVANDQVTGRSVGSGGVPTRIASAVEGRFIVAGFGGAERSSTTVADNSQHSAAIANTAANRLTIAANNVEADSDTAPGTALSSSQYGQADVGAASALKLAGIGQLTDSRTTIAGNTNRSTAIVNDVDNDLRTAVAGIGARVPVDPSASSNFSGPPRSVGDTALANQQFSGGSATATASTATIIVDGETGLDRSVFTAASNLTSADATANQAWNAVTANTITGARQAALSNSQTSIADVAATAFTRTNEPFPLEIGPATGAGTVSVKDNMTIALSRGNIADNALSMTGASVQASPASLHAGRFSADVTAQAAVLNNQTNLGSVNATAISLATPLNGFTGQAASSTVTVTGNLVSASAYGNTASNAMTLSGPGRLPTAAVANAQTNGGAITAQVSGSAFGVHSAALRGSTFTLSGNQLIAAATGNQASNVVTSAR